MIDVEQIVSGAGLAGVIYALAYTYRQWRASRREARSGSMADVTAANTALLASLQEEREENRRLSGRVEALELQNALLYEKLRDQRRQYEQEIGGLREQLSGVQRQLDNLQARLRDEPGMPS